MCQESNRQEDQQQQQLWSAHRIRASRLIFAGFSAFNFSKGKSGRPGSIQHDLDQSIDIAVFSRTTHNSYGFHFLFTLNVYSTSLFHLRISDISESKLTERNEIRAHLYEKERPCSTWSAFDRSKTRLTICVFQCNIYCSPIHPI